MSNLKLVQDDVSTNGVVDTDTGEVDALLSRITKEHTNTSVYPVMDVPTLIGELTAVPDISNASQRSRRFAAMFSFRIFSDFDKMTAQGVPLQKNDVTYLIDADNLEDLKERLHTEINLAMDLQKLASEKPEVYQEVDSRLKEMFNQNPK